MCLLSYTPCGYFSIYPQGVFVKWKFKSPGIDFPPEGWYARDKKEYGKLDQSNRRKEYETKFDAHIEPASGAGTGVLGILVTALAHEKTYAITVYDDAGDGYLTLNKSEAKEDDTVYIYAHPESGNWLTYLKVTNSRGYELSVSYVRKNVYSFTMPASAVTIKAVFAPKWLTIAGILGIFEDNSSDFPFTDVALGTWYYQAVEFVYDYGYMDGVSATRFDPDGALSRGMLAKVLYNVEEEQRDFPTEFSDVPNSVLVCRRGKLGCRQRHCQGLWQGQVRPRGSGDPGADGRHPLPLCRAQGL